MTNRRYALLLILVYGTSFLLLGIFWHPVISTWASWAKAITPGW